MTVPPYDTPADEEPGATAPVPVSPKVTAATVGSFAASVVLALLLALSSPEGQAYIAGLPPVLQFLVVAALPPVVTFVAGFVVPNTTKYLAPALTAARARGRR